jgi:FkbM family methyltransferase
VKDAWERLKFRRVQQRLAGPKLLRSFAQAYPEAFFVEIGSNDGEQHDHLQPLISSHPWSGIMVEPVPYVFERLRRNYGDAPRVTLENAAIAERDGRLPFYHLGHVEDARREGLPQWYDAIGSFSRAAILRHVREIPDIEQRLVTTEVPSLTFESLCAKHGVDTIDLLLVDTEGYDYEILRSIDFATRRPRLVVYEHYHLPPDERAQCRARLERFGYETLEEGLDTFCLRVDAHDRLTRQWRRLRPGVPGASIHDLPA